MSLTKHETVMAASAAVVKRSTAKELAFAPSSVKNGREAAQMAEWVNQARLAKAQEARLAAWKQRALGAAQPQPVEVEYSIVEGWRRNVAVEEASL